MKEDDGSIKAYTSIPCDTLGSCIPFVKTTDANTCTKNGYIAGPPRSSTHLDLIMRFGKSYLPMLIGYVVPVTCGLMLIVFSVVFSVVLLSPTDVFTLATACFAHVMPRDTHVL